MRTWKAASCGCLLLVAACGRIDYDNTAIDARSSNDPGVTDGAPQIDSASQSDAAPQTLASSLLLTSTCTGTGPTVLTIDNLVPVGSALMVRIVLRGASGTPTSVTDSRGNQYQLDLSTSGSSAHGDIYSAAITSALTPGDTITAIHGDIRSNGVLVWGFPQSMRPYAVAAQKFAIADVDVVGQIELPSDGVLMAVVSLASNSMTTTGWDELPQLTPRCGGAPGQSIQYAHTLPVTAGEQVRFSGTLASGKNGGTLGLILYSH